MPESSLSSNRPDPIKEPKEMMEKYIAITRPCIEFGALRYANSKPTKVKKKFF